MLYLHSPVTALRGVGDVRAKALARLGIHTIRDLLHHYPRGYQLRGDIKTIAAAADYAARGNDEPVALMLTISSEPNLHHIRRGMSILRMRAFDETGVCEITFFNQNFLRDLFHTGGQFRFYGRITTAGKKVKMSSPLWEAVTEDVPLPPIVPVYPLTTGISQKVLSQMIRDVLEVLAPHLPETLPDDLLLENSLCTLPYAVRNMHQPTDTEALLRARRRIIFEEFFEMGLAMAAINGTASESGVSLQPVATDPLTDLLPYALTGAQARSIREISADMTSGLRMNRLLMGDVGSGKTVVAAAAMYVAAKNGYQSVLMAPTEILAAQHYEEISVMMKKLGFRTVLLSGAVTPARRRALVEEIASVNDAPSIIIGTHALLSDDIRFSRLGLVIEDEQHCFGVHQRAALPSKGEGVHMLVISATPIPRTLSLVAYGGIRVSRLDEMPPGRQTVDTFVVTESYRDRLNAFIRKQVEEGHQVYIVCPSVEENPEKKEKISEDPEELTDFLFDDRTVAEEKPPLKAAVDLAAELSSHVFPDLSVAFVHGKMKTEEKDRIMSAFSRGEIQILVSTTVIEVGVNVPNATLMVIENAERFGLSQLHQLRGRVGRGKAKSYCILVSDSTAETAKRRLNILRKNHDGFAIAEEDLLLRGPGDFLKTDGVVRQHGSMTMAFAASEGDTDVLENAMQAARVLLERDPGLLLPEHEALREAVDAIRKNAANTLN